MSEEKKKKPIKVNHKVSCSVCGIGHGEFHICACTDLVCGVFYCSKCHEEYFKDTEKGEIQKARIHKEKWAAKTLLKKPMKNPNV
jgi:hypothetical protein